MSDAARLRHLLAGLPPAHPLYARTVIRLREMGEIPDAPPAPVDTARAAFLARFPLREKTDDEWLSEIGEDEVRANLEALRADVAALHDRLNPGEERAKERARKRGEDTDKDGWTTPARRKRAEAPGWADTGLGQACARCGRAFAGGDWMGVAEDGWRLLVCGGSEQGSCWRRQRGPAARVAGAGKE